MKASTFIKKIQKQIDKSGDLPIEVSGEYDLLKMKVRTVGPYSKHSSPSHANKCFIEVSLDGF